MHSAVLVSLSSEFGPISSESDVNEDSGFGPAFEDDAVLSPSLRHDEQLSDVLLPIDGSVVPLREEVVVGPTSAS